MLATNVLPALAKEANERQAMGAAMTHEKLGRTTDTEMLGLHFEEVRMHLTQRVCVIERLTGQSLTPALAGATAIVALSVPRGPSAHAPLRDCA